MTTYQRPSQFRVRVINPVLRYLVLQCNLGSSGEQDVMRVLRVRGRKSGRTYDVPVRIAMLNEQRYILSMLGNSQWARNLRAESTAELIVGATIEPIHAEEIQGDDKTAFLQWYCQHPQYEMRARFALKADTKHLTPTEIDRLASLYPVFRLEIASPL